MTSPLVYILIAPLFLVYTTPLPAEVANPAAQLNRSAVHAEAEETDIVVIEVEQSIGVDQNNSGVKDNIEIITEASPNITDPGCVEKWIEVPGLGQVLASCEELCGGDEMLQERDSRPCLLINETYSEKTPKEGLLGVCVEGVCVPKDPKSTIELGANATIEEAVATEPASSTESVPETIEPTETVFKDSCYENMIHVPEKGYVLTQCDKTCGGDEVLALGDAKPCAVINESYPNGSKLITLGDCFNGFCRVQHPIVVIFLAENSTTEVVAVNEQDETLTIETERPSRPQCENVSLIAGGKEVAVTKCTDPCGDEIKIITENMTCIHHTSSGEADVFGKCKSGECVLGTENPMEGPKDPCKIHEISANNETVYLKCRYVCEEDEAMSVADGSLCYLENENNLYTPKTTGRCNSGQCQADAVNVITDNTPTGKPNCTNSNVVYHNKTIAVSQCHFTCGDVVEQEADNTTCVPDMHTNQGGYYTVGNCKDGECVTGLKDSNPTGPPDSCNRHEINTTGERVFLTCTFSCEGDEMYSLFQGEACLISEGDSSLELYTESYVVGICKEGKCVKGNDTAVVDGPTADYDTTSKADFTEADGASVVTNDTTISVAATPEGELLAMA